MITQINKNFNENNLENLITKYNEYCLNANFTFFKCPSCHCTGSIVRHGYYCRTIYINGIKYRICILRIKCKKCGKTHAVLPSFVIPYIQLSIYDVVKIIKDNSAGDSTFYKKLYLLKQYKNWYNRLLSIFNSLNEAFENLNTLITECARYFNRGFLQNHRGDYFVI